MNKINIDDGIILQSIIMQKYNEWKKILKKYTKKLNKLLLK